MNELAMLQIKMNTMEKKANDEVRRVLRDGVAMLNNGGHPKAIAAYLQMAVYFYGRERIATALETSEFGVLKKYMRRSGGK